MRSFVQLCVVLARAVLSDTKARRQWMFVGSMLVMGLVFGGYFLAGGFLAEHPVVFGLYVLGCLAGLALLMLLALFDMLKVRQSFAEERRSAAEEVMREIRERARRGPGES